MASPLLTRKSVVLVKAESTYGTDPTPVVGTDAVLTRMPTISPDILVLERNNTAFSLSPLSPVTGRKLWRANYEVELKSAVVAGDGSASTPLEIDDILRSAGLSPTYTAETGGGANDGYVTYAPISTSIESVTSYIYIDQVLREMNGAFSNLGFRFVAGEYPIMSVDMLGLYVKPVDATPSSPSYYDEDPVMVESVGLQINSFSVVCPELEINLNNRINEYRDVNSADGMKRLRLVDRNPTARFRIEEPLIADKDFWATMDASTPIAVAFTHGSVLGYRITVTIPAFTITNITPSDGDGLSYLDIEGVCARSSDAGNDEITFKFF